MKKLKVFITLIILAIIFSGFYYINWLNYWKHIEIKRSFVEHPENLPKKEFASKTSFWFKNLRADLFRLEAIQYIWSNPIGSEYKKYLFAVLDLITELNPYFEQPYNIGQLLLPSYNERYEDLSEEEQKRNIEEWVKLWLKWIKYFCDAEKVEAIKSFEIEKMQDLKTLLESEDFKNPCKTHSIPYYLAYIYFYYKNDPNTAADYYKIAAAVEWAPSWLKVMAGVMSGKWWDREKSFNMFLSLAWYIEPENEICQEFSKQLLIVWNEIFRKSHQITPELLKNIAKVRNEAFWEFGEENEDDILSDTTCSNYLNKSVRELNLEYLDRANKQYEAKLWKPSIKPEELLEEWFIDYIPIDFQQYKDHGIKYKYNKDTKVYDFDLKYKDDTDEIFYWEE